MFLDWPAYIRSNFSCLQHSCNTNQTNPPYPLFLTDVNKTIIEVFIQGQQQIVNLNHSRAPYT